MAGDLSYLSYVPGLADPDVQRFASGILLGGALIALSSAVKWRLASPYAVEAAIIPKRRASFFGIADVFVEGFVKFYDSILGDEGRKHLSFVGSIFIFILLSNFLGLVPGMPVITNTVWINVGLAITVFIYFNYQGIKEHGLAGYLKHFCGPVLIFAPFMFVLEMFSLHLRILTLNLRLYWNIKADHIVLGIFTDLLGAGIPAVFYVLGTFVCFMQAFIFTTLSMVYILLATQHEEEGH